MTERVERWRGRLERLVVWSYAGGMALASLIYLITHKHGVLQLSLWAGTAGVTGLAIIAVLESRLKPRLTRQRVTGPSASDL